MLDFDPQFTAPTITPLTGTLLMKVAQTANACVDYTIDLIEAAYPGTGPITSWGGGSTDEVDLRPPATMGLCLAVMGTSALLDEAGTGHTAAECRSVARRILVSYARTHAGNGGYWGGVAIAEGAVIPPFNGITAPVGPDWQGALWVSNAALGALVIWSELSAPERVDVQDMVRREADRFLNYTVPNYRDRSGKVITPGDTKAEENSWNATMLWIAAGMLPTDPHAETWVSKAIELSLSVGATPATPTTRPAIHGTPLRSWVKGSNIETNGTMENHGIINPTYISASFNQQIVSATAFAILRGVIPAATLWNMEALYYALTDVTFVSPPQLWPGGTIYTSGSWAIYYPGGADGADADRMSTYVSTDALALISGLDRASSSDASTWLALHANRQISLQAASPSVRRGHAEFWNATMPLLSSMVLPGVPFSNRTPAELIG